MATVLRILLISLVVLCPKAVFADLAGDYILTVDGEIRSYDAAGNLQDTVVIEVPGDNQPRDLVYLGDGKYAVYNGTFDAYLSIYDDNTTDWEHFQVAGFSTVNNVSYGGIGFYENRIFLTDMLTAGDGATRGIVEFNMQTESFQRFATDTEYEDLTIGLDQKLYAVSNSRIEIFDPLTHAKLESFLIPGNHDVRGVVADTEGRIFAITWDEFLYEFDTDGNILNSLDVDPFMSGFGDPMDIDLDRDGNILFGHRFGNFYLSDKEFTDVTEFDSGDVSTAFVAFNYSAVPEPGMVGFLGAVMLLGIGIGLRKRMIARA